MDADINFFGGEYADYVDQVRIVYHSVDHPSDSSTRATVVLIADAGTEVDSRKLRTWVEQLHYTPMPDGERRHSPFISNERFSKTSWGAAGASLEIIMWVSAAAASGIVGGAAWDGLKGILARFRQRESNSNHYVDAADAQRRALQMAAATWKDLGDLTLLSCTLHGNTAVIVLRAADGSTITASPEIVAEGAMGTITRSYPELPRADDANPG
jgi:hypothetical protein